MSQLVHAFKRLFPRAPVSALVEYAIPAGQRVYAIGDIHGRLDLLEGLIRQVDDDDRRRGEALTTLILLGDLIDRGPDSCGVVERVMELTAASDRVRVLKGNHEQMLLMAAEGDAKAVRLFTRIGGRETLLSYGVSEQEYREADFEKLAGIIRRTVPERHIEFMKSLEDYIQIGGYTFVHAGVLPGRPMEDQDVSDLYWIRHKFLDNPGDHGSIIVHGHSITEDVDVRENRIGIDTGAYASGVLTAIGLQAIDRWFLATSR